MSTPPNAPQATATATNNRTLLPGFGRPLNYIPQPNDADYTGALFPSALSNQNLEHGNVALPMTTLRELTMLRFMNIVTDKQDWHVKVNDEDISSKWKSEAIASDWDMTNEMVDWCISELRHKATFIADSPPNPPPIIVYNGDVVKSDFAFSQEFKLELQSAVRAYEEKIPERLKDWHPNSEEKVWDLVHPSLFPLLYGRTRVLENGKITDLENFIRLCGKGKIAPVPDAADTQEFGQDKQPAWHINHFKNPFSTKFQWLPSEVDISGDEARITTYISNLHPQEEKLLYDLIAKLITVSIPQWDLTLAPIRANTSFQRVMRIQYTDVEYNPDPERGPEEEWPQQEPSEDEDDFWRRRDEWFQATRKVVRPEPNGMFEPLPSPPKFSLKEEYGNRGLQVIVKLANIELTPEKPEYHGGSWHVEGQMNEHIVATSIYYYSCSNITTSTLSFRQQSTRDETDEIGYEQHHHEWLSEVFGCEQDGPAVQEVGGVETREGRLLTFPNILQHRVGPFKLDNPTKPGHRKIVALFLVDPNIKIISTANVPCQRQDWWWEVTRSLQEKHSTSSSLVGLEKDGALSELPRELQDHILEDVDFPISLQEAKRLRLELMGERKDFVIKHATAFETSSTFSLCEH